MPGRPFTVLLRRADDDTISTTDRVDQATRCDDWEDADAAIEAFLLSEQPTPAPLDDRHRPARPRPLDPADWARGSKSPLWSLESVAFTDGEGNARRSQEPRRAALRREIAMKPIVDEARILAADGAPPRFVARARSGASQWVVTQDPASAARFYDEAELAGALAFMQRQAGHRHNAPGGWKPVCMTARFSFRDA